jgi:mevalonate kinase
MKSPPATLTCSAPGSLMLMGEHAVLHGRRALCAAIDRRIRVHLHSRSDSTLRIDSALGSFEGDIHDLPHGGPLAFVFGALHALRPKRGADIRIDADFASTLGFGSSAAVTVATLAALQAARGEPLDRPALFEQALAVYRDVQGRGSGADLAAAVFGGVVRYRAEPLEIEPFVCDLPLYAFYAGYKTKTADVIARVDLVRAKHPDLFARIFDAMDQAVDSAAAALRNGDLAKLGTLFRIHHGLQAALGTSDDTLDHMVHALLAQPGVLGAKISGSGLGDCVVALGGAPALPRHEHFPLRIDPTGLQREH